MSPAEPEHHAVAPSSPAKPKSASSSQQGSTRFQKHKGSHRSKSSSNNCKSTKRRSNSRCKAVAPSPRHRNNRKLMSDDSSSEASDSDSDDSESSTISSGAMSDGSDDARSESELESELESESQSGEPASKSVSKQKGWAFIDDSAKESKKPKRKMKSKVVSITLDVLKGDQGAEGFWNGKAKGPIKFRKTPKGHEALGPGIWSYSRDGVERQNLSDRAIGDIHFSPAFSGRSGFDYWVCVEATNGQRWAKCCEGQAHPSITGYVLKPRDAKWPPKWVLTQSFRKHTARK